jgi:hypothetical protein
MPDFNAAIAGALEVVGVGVAQTLDSQDSVGLFPGIRPMKSSKRMSRIAAGSKEAPVAVLPVDIRAMEEVVERVVGRVMSKQAAEMDKKLRNLSQQMEAVLSAVGSSRSTHSCNAGGGIPEEEGGGGE